MKVEVKGYNPTTEKPFPKLMSTDSGYIVLFTGDKIGICLRTSKNGIDKIGETYDTWNMEGFTDFQGTITLSND